MNEIKTKLSALHLSGMAHCMQTIEETRKLHELSFVDGLQLLLQSEMDQRESNRYARLIKNASFRYQASIEEIEINAQRGIDKSRLLSLSTGKYISNGEAIIITGSAGTGKSFLASALGHQACRQGFSVAYFNMQKLMIRLKISRLEGSIIRSFDKIAKTDLLILDDFGLSVFDAQQQLDFMELIEDRHAKKATIIAGQIPVKSWFDLFSEETIADSFLDRIAHTAHRFELKGESLRKKR